LRALHRGGPTSRADLAKLTGLTPASVSAVVRELLDNDLVEELGTRRARGVGKPATLVGIRPDSRYVLCVGLSEPDQFVAALVDLSGKVVVRRTHDRKGRTGRRAETLVARIVADLVADADRPLLGIGVATPGIVDDDGTVITAAHLGWAQVPLGGGLAHRTGLPVHVVNDANAVALAELVFGADDAQNLILVRVDEGVGAGLVLGGSLFTGTRSAAGEIGHVVIDEHGDPCACGKRGCLETVVSEPLLGQRLDADGAVAADVLGHAGSRLGVALATVLGALDISDVVLSGPASVTSKTFLSAARGEIAARTMPALADRLDVRPTTFGFDDVLVGAAALVLDRELGIH
jgi:predicted NBD/HSP70 family sugar kinase